MSLILEALKKSEQQRQLGEAPHLGTPIMLTRRRRSLLPLLMLAILAALGVGWWLMRSPTPGRNAAVAPPAAATPPAVAATAPAVKPVTPPAVRPGHGKIGGAVAITPPTAVAPVVPVPRADDRPGSVQLPAALPAGAPVVEGGGAPHARPEPPGPASPLEQPAPAAAPATAPAAPAAAVPATPRATPPVSPASKPAAAAPAYPSVWELPYSIRKDLPALNLTLHMYAAVPADRFVVVNGERHGEGDEIADGVTLVQISADGVVLEFKGQRFTFPRDGR